MYRLNVQLEDCNFKAVKLHVYQNQSFHLLVYTCICPKIIHNVFLDIASVDFNSVAQNL